MKHWLPTSILILFSVICFGQTTEKKHWYVEPAFRYAYHIPFKPYKAYPVYCADLRLGWQTTGKQPWERFFNYPLVGIGFRYEHNTMRDYYDAESQSNITLGGSFALFGYCNGHIIKKPRFQFDYTWGIGLAYWPLGDNRLISSPLTVHLNLDFGPVFRLHDKIDLFARASFSHASNGAIRIPNKGVNVIGGQAGIRVYLDSRAPELHDSLTNAFQKSNTIYISESPGFRESNTIPGRYCLGNTFQLGYARRFHPCFSYGGGLDLLYTGENKVMYESHGELDRYKGIYAWSLAPYVSFELVYGHFIGHLDIAYYLIQPTQYVPRHYLPFYERLAFRYHFGQDDRLFAGVGMKVHGSRIDYIEWTVGMKLFQWKDKK